VGKGYNITEHMSAYTFDVIINGVGHHSFTKTLRIEV
jgi:hypothetical protein